MKKLIAAGVVLALAAVAWWWLRRAPAAAPAAHVSRTRRLDVAKLKAETTARIARAKQLARHAATGSAGPPALPPSHSLHAMLIDPKCDFGPRAICDAVTDLVDSCDAGSASDCAVVAHYVTETPPYAMIGIALFRKACKLGDQPSCDRFDEINKPSDAPCDADVFACSWRAKQDLERSDEACALGAADACASAAYLTKDSELARAYLETGCQAGSPIQCHALAVALGPGCAPNKDQPCYAPDPAEAKLAADMACSAGFCD
jgi:hypothetical protein